VEAAVFMTQAESIVRRIMKCVALDDPNIKKVRTLGAFLQYEHQDLEFFQVQISSVIKPFYN